MNNGKKGDGTRGTGMEAVAVHYSIVRRMVQYRERGNEEEVGSGGLAGVTRRAT